MFSKVQFKDTGGSGRTKKKKKFDLDAALGNDLLKKRSVEGHKQIMSLFCGTYTNKNI